MGKTSSVFFVVGVLLFAFMIWHSSPESMRIAHDSKPIGAFEQCLNKSVTSVREEVRKMTRRLSKTEYASLREVIRSKLHECMGGAEMAFNSSINSQIDLAWNDARYPANLPGLGGLPYLTGHKDSSDCTRAATEYASRGWNYSNAFKECSGGIQIP